MQVAEFLAIFAFFLRHFKAERNSVLLLSVCPFRSLLNLPVTSLNSINFSNISNTVFFLLMIFMY